MAETCIKSLKMGVEQQGRPGKATEVAASCCPPPRQDGSPEQPMKQAGWAPRHGACDAGLSVSTARPRLWREFPCCDLTRRQIVDNFVMSTYS